MRIIPFKQHHLEIIELQESQAYLSSWVTPDAAKALEAHISFTGIADDKVVGCAGMIKRSEYWGTVWAYLSKDSGKHFVSIHRAVRKLIEGSMLKRIDATVDFEFEAGHRWLKLLGFEMEAERMRCYRPDGGDSSLYARIRQ
jgi:hypothetical protein